MKSGVAQSIAEWIERTIAYIQTVAGKLGKLLIVVCYRAAGVLMVVVERLLTGSLRHRSGELTRWRFVAKDDIAECIAHL